MLNHPSYIGRFAPSPSGSLHFGSLIAALGSYLRAKSLNGKWKLRIEDIDPPREIIGAADEIISTLVAFGFQWDGDILYQSQRLDAYQAYLEKLISSDQAYYCQCTRKEIKEMGGVYNGQCGKLTSSLNQGAIRIRNHLGVNEFMDQLMGHVVTSKQFANEDFIIKRRDGLYAYQLAVVLDDAYQGVTEIVRGCDLLDATVRQQSLYQLFHLPSPHWLHLPLASIKSGFKLSKQNHAQAINKQSPQPLIQAALKFLGQQAVENHDNPEKMLVQAIAQFELDRIPKRHEIVL